jgi:hypothetical protein
MGAKKIVFIAFAIEDERQRDLLKGQALNTASPFEYIDMSVREAYETGWKEKVRARIKRSHGVIALVSQSSALSSGQNWELQCAKEEGKKIIGIRAYADDNSTIPGITVRDWTWENIKTFINSL